jgi:hypothetical protein
MPCCPSARAIRASGAAPGVRETGVLVAIVAVVAVVVVLTVRTALFGSRVQPGRAWSLPTGPERAHQSLCARNRRCQALALGQGVIR